MIVVPRSDYKFRICNEHKDLGVSKCSNCIKVFTDYYCNHPTVTDNHDDYPNWCPFLQLPDCYQLSFFNEVLWLVITLRLFKNLLIV